MNIIEQVQEAMRDDDCISDQQSEAIVTLYETAEEEVKNLVDDIFIALCGWSLKTLIERSYSETCDDCHAAVRFIIGCPDGAEICQSCFDAGAH